MRWPLAQALARFAIAAHRVLLGWPALSIFAIALTIHLLTVLSIWLLGIAQGLALPAADSAVLFAVMMTISVVPISVSGWGLRELAVTALLQSHGFPAERALLFSVCFGLALIVASLPGAVTWALYLPKSRGGPRPVRE